MRVRISPPVRKLKPTNRTGFYDSEPKKRYTSIMWNKIVNGFQYILGFYMVIAGGATALKPATAVAGPMSFIYESHFALVILGCWFIISGAALIAGLVKENILIGYALVSIYTCFLVSTILQSVAIHSLAEWIGNLIMTFIVGLLWVRFNYRHIKKFIK